MKKTSPVLFSLLIVFSIIVLYGCIEKKCSIKDEVVENKFNSEYLSFFSYTSFDTLRFKLKGQFIYQIFSDELKDDVIEEKDIKYPDCGIGTIYKNETRTVKYYGNNSKLIYKADFKLNNLGSMLIEIRFSNCELLNSYSLQLLKSMNPDTITLNGVFYDDIYFQERNVISEKIYYSKSKGLISVIENGVEVFQILNN